MESKGTKRGRKTVKESEYKRDRGSVKGASERAERMKTGGKKQQKQALMHLYTQCQGPLLMQTQGGNKIYTRAHTHTLKKERQADNNFNSITAHRAHQEI